ncbi:MAG: DUF881 domain-containing protein [Solirubrobacterales bacterium]
MPNYRTLFVVGLAALIVGLMLSQQFQANRLGPTYVSAARWTSLTKQINDLRRENEALAADVARYRSQLPHSSSGSANRQIGKELERNSRLAGLTQAQGAGIMIVLDDGNDPLRVGEGLVHDSMLRTAVNELNKAGAAAISINGERYISTTEIRCAGPAILMNIHRIAPPFEIRAIGNQRSLKKALEDPYGALLLLRYQGVRIKTWTDDNLEIPAYNGMIQIRYARPLSQHAQPK